MSLKRIIGLHTRGLWLENDNHVDVSGMRVSIVGPPFFSYIDAIVGLMKEEGIVAQAIDERGTDSFILKSIFRIAFLRSLFRAIVRKRHQGLRDEILEFKSTHVLFISPESITQELIEELKASGLRTLLYMWDSFDNKLSAREFLGSFDKAATFDPLDAKTHNLPIISLFAEPCFFSEIGSQPLREVDITFVGTVHSSRPQVLDRFLKSELLNGSSKFMHMYRGNLYYHLRALIMSGFSRKLRLTGKSLSKDSVAMAFKNSRYILDITHENQRGLTSRSFEALAAGCVLVTNNKWAESLLAEFSDRIKLYDDIRYLNLTHTTWRESELLESKTDFLTINRFYREIRDTLLFP